MKAKMNIRSIIATMAMMCMISMFFINISFATNTGKIITETAKLRSEPNTSSTVLELASEGEEVEILGEENGWYKVKYKDITGYIRNDLVEADGVLTENNNEIVSEEKPVMIEPEKSEENTEEQPQAQEVKEVKIELGNYPVAENVKLKIIPLISSMELGEVEEDSEVEVIQILNKWVKVKTSEGNEGWIRTDKLAIDQEDEQPVDNTADNETQQEPQTMYVISQLINVRSQASTSSQVITQLTIGAKVTVTSTNNGWCHVDVDGTEGYISASLLSTIQPETSRSGMTTRNNNAETNNVVEETIVEENVEPVENTTATEQEPEEDKVNAEPESTQEVESNIESSSIGDEIVAYAQQFLGYKYVYGGETTKGFDCSGFTKYVYNHFGISINRTAAEQYSNGVYVSSSELQPGDLVFFGTSGITHVGIYIGGGNFIHAANSASGVKISTLLSGYYKTYYVGARRLI